uniref:Putative secreted protein n=1 Tax=Ixodes ricinus TaxID=34613 RepID=A0A6B0U2U8_IXORI
MMPSSSARSSSQFIGVIVHLMAVVCSSPCRPDSRPSDGVTSSTRSQKRFFLNFTTRRVAAFTSVPTVRRPPGWLPTSSSTRP